MPKIRPRTYIRAGTRTPTHAYVRPGLVYMERQRTVAMVSCSSAANRLGQNGETAPCSSGGNGMRRVHQEPTGLDGTAKTRPGVSRNGGNGLVFKLLWSKQGVVDQEGCGVPQNGGNGLVLERLWLKWGHVHWEGCGIPQNGTPRDIVHPPSTSSLQPPRATAHPLSTSSSLHLLLFIHHIFLLPPPATIHLASIDYCSISPPWGPVHPPQAALVWRPPRDPVHPVATVPYYQGVLFIQPPPGNVHPQPTNRLDSPHLDYFYVPRAQQQWSLFIERQPNTGWLLLARGLDRLQ